MISYEDFKASICKLHESRVHKLNKSLGVYDSYKYIRKNKWFDIGRPLTEHEYYSIIRAVNKAIVDKVSNGGEVRLPLRMGTIELRKYTNKVYYKNGNLKCSYAIDWSATLKLWHEDIVNRSKKTLVRKVKKETCVIRYNKKNAVYNNKTFFEFLFNRKFKELVTNKFNNKLIDAFKL